MVSVSICIPAYNQVESFKRALDSLLNQSFEDYEIIVTDDSDNDDIFNLIQSSSHSQKIQYHKNSQRLGAPENWNRAISLADGKYIKILHHDDWFSSEDSLQQFVGSLESHPDVGLVFCATKNVRHDDSFLIHKPTADKQSIQVLNSLNLLLGNWIGPPSSIMYRNDGCTLFDRNLKWLVDIDFYIRLAWMKKILFIDQTLISSTAGGKDQLTRSCENNPQIQVYEHFYLMEKFREQLAVLVDKAYFARLQRILARFSIRHVSQIRAYGYYGDIPAEVLAFIGFTRVSPLLSRLYAKALEGLRRWR
jgi:glycosyltransferase involved in cell wall biosynthesis